MEIKCPHCNGELIKNKENDSMKCEFCGCIFRLVLARYNNECYRKMFPDKGKITLREVRKKKTRKRKKHV